MTKVTACGTGAVVTKDDGDKVVVAEEGLATFKGAGRGAEYLGSEVPGGRGFSGFAADCGGTGVLVANALHGDSVACAGFSEALFGRPLPFFT